MNGRKATGVWSFHGKEHEINLDTNDDKVTIEVQDIETADQWRASFLSKQIEDLTRKTGNYKHISVFLNMLESAVLKSSESVSLELLTYNDLENLRQRRNPTFSAKPPSLTSAAQTKRYLILTYSTEFDRIHYPLALPYVGKPDPVELQETVRHLQQELDKYKNKATHRSSSSFIRLQKKYDTLLTEKEELERVLEDIQNDMLEDCSLNRKREDTSLRNVVQKLEEDLLKDKTKFQRIISKKNEEIRALTTEVDDLRSSERLLNSRVKSLTNEIAIMRRHSPTITRGHSSNKNNYARVGCGQRDGLRSSPSVQNYYTRKRSSSVENCIRTHSTGSHKNRSRTPSPRAGFQRFNPTAYIENKRRLQNEIDSKLQKPRSRSSSASSIGRYPSKATPTSSYKSQTRRINLGMRSRTSSVESGRSSRRSSSVEYINGSTLNDSVTSRLSRNERKVQVSRGKRHHHQTNSSTPKVSTASRKKQRHNNSNQMDRSIEIKQIDARLSALQKYMKKSLERKR